MPATAPPKENLPPNATLEADPVNGTGPLDVTFRLDADDPEGGALYWTFELDLAGQEPQHGSVLPTNLSYTLPVGRHTATFTVDDGNHSVVEVVQVNVTEPPVARTPGPITMNGTITGFWTDATGYVTPPNRHTFPLDVPVETIAVSLAFGNGSIDLDFEVFDPSGQRVGRQAYLNEPSGELPGPFVGPGERPIYVNGSAADAQGVWTVAVHAALAIEGAYTVQIRFT